MKIGISGLKTIRIIVLLSLYCLGILTIIGSSGSESTFDQSVKASGNTTETQLVPDSVVIDAPADGGSFPEKSYVSFSGKLVDANNAAISDATYQWTSSLDGVIGDGPYFPAINTLSEGDHTITLTATKDDVAYTNSIALTIGKATNADNPNPPVPVINTPADGTVFEEGEYIVLEGTATDTEDFLLSGGSFVWTSSKQGIIGSGATVPPINSLVPGDHIITLKVTDSGGATGSASVAIKVEGTLNGNTPPKATINSPLTDSVFDEGDSITFSGTGLDAEDGSLEQYTPANDYLVWTSSKNGPIGVGTGFSVPLSSLQSGKHTITLTATDRDGATGTDTITITVGNTPPTAEIIFPDASAGALSYNFGNSIVFVGKGTDTEDGNLTGNLLEWHSSIDGALGIGSKIDTNSLSPGFHYITLTASDSDGASASAVITLSVGNTPPTAEILFPKDGASYSYGGDPNNPTNIQIVFDGKGTDNEDGPLSGTALEWFSSIDGPITTPVGPSTGTSVILINPTIGSHVITLTVTDSDFATATATITIDVTE